MNTIDEEYDPVTCITAAELRAAGAAGTAVPSSIPDCAIRRNLIKWGVGGARYDAETKKLHVEMSVTFCGPFRWVVVE